MEQGVIAMLSHFLFGLILLASIIRYGTDYTSAEQLKNDRVIEARKASEAKEKADNAAARTLGLIESLEKRIEAVEDGNLSTNKEL